MGDIFHLKPSKYSMTTIQYSMREGLKETFIFYDLKKNSARKHNKKGMHLTGFCQHDQDMPLSCHRALYI